MIYITDIKLDQKIYGRLYSLLSRTRDPVSEAINELSASFDFPKAKIIMQKPFVQIISEREDITSILSEVVRITGINLLEAEVI